MSHNIIGIVGSEESKFTQLGRDRARTLILSLIDSAELVVSGGCHLGGIDIWTIEEAQYIGIPYLEFFPKRRSWSGGYKERNLEIAEASDIVHCITVDSLPKDYEGMKFNLCYHCGTNTHIKSGGCWTVKQAIRLGKFGEIHVIGNY